MNGIWFKQKILQVLPAPMIGWLYRIIQPWLVSWRRRARLPFLLNGPGDLVQLGIKGHHVFFGYFDVTPFSSDSQLVLAHKVSRNASPGRDPVELICFDRKQPVWRILGRSELWCWQQGARLRWVEDGLYAYNRMVDGVPGFCVQSLEQGGVQCQVKVPLYDVDWQGRAGLSLNFHRLERLRPGYGFLPGHDPTAGEAAPDHCGIDLVDLRTGHKRMLWSLREACDDLCTRLPTSQQSKVKKASHYFNHLSWSPDGTRFILFHLWSGQSKRRSRAIVMNKDGRLISVLTREDENASHFAWIDDETILLTIAKRDGRVSYQQIDLSDGQRSAILPDQLDLDGHPSIIAGSTVQGSVDFVTDTYPDRYREQHLLLIRAKTRQVERLGRFYSPLHYQGECRCDLHPRCSPGGRLIAIDSAHQSLRQLCLLQISPQ